MSKIKIAIFSTAFLVLQACSLSSETTYYKDSASSMEANVLMDESALGMLNMMSGQQKQIADSKTFQNLTTDWKSLYDLQKDEKITLNQDSAKVLKKLFLKLNKEDGQVYGLSMKYDKLFPKEIASLLSQSKQLKSLPLQNVATWNGKTLIINTEKFNAAETLTEIAEAAPGKQNTTPKTKSDSVEVYGRQMAQGILGMMKMFNMNLNSTIKFQEPIATISGKHDFVKQIDDRTIQINVRTKDLMDENKALTHKDKQIVVTTK